MTVQTITVALFLIIIKNGVQRNNYSFHTEIFYCAYSSNWLFINLF